MNAHAADAVASGSCTRWIATERRSSESRAYVLRQESAPCVLLVHAAADLARVLLVISIILKSVTVSRPNCNEAEQPKPMSKHSRYPKANTVPGRHIPYHAICCSLGFTFMLTFMIRFHVHADVHDHAQVRACSHIHED